MADLSTMFNQLGPAGGSILAGVQMGNEANAAKSEQAMRQAQMDKILMETDQAKLMNPLELKAKQQTIDANTLKAKADEHAYHTQVLSDVIPELEKVPNGPGQRLAALQQYAAKRGVPMSPEELAQYAAAPDLLQTLKKQHEWGLTQNEKYRQAMDVAIEQGKWHKYSADSSATTQKAIEQMRIDAGKYNKNKVANDVNAALLKPISSAQKAEILESAYFAADAAGDMKMAAQYKQRAKEARVRAAEDAQNRAIGAPGTMGYATQGGDIDLQNKPAPAANAPIGGGPALGTAANPIVLK
jgi:hypothetical protein